MMNRQVLGALYGLEVRQLLRDPRTLFFGGLLPALVMPLFLFIASRGEEGREERQKAEIYSYAIVGQEAGLARSLLAEWQQEDGLESPLHLEEKQVENPATALANDSIQVYLEAFSALPPSLVRQDQEGVAEPRVPRFRLAFRADRDSSLTALGALRERLEAMRQQRRWTLLVESGFPVQVEEVAVFAVRDLATSSRRTGASLGRWAGFFLIFMVLVGGSTLAADTLAGEKERGSLETLLTTAAGRLEILFAKQLAIASLGVSICGIQLFILWLCLRFAWLPAPEGFAVGLSAGMLLLLLGLALPLVAIVASVLLLVSGRARSYREFQVLFFPVFLAFLLPAGAAFLPGLGLRSAVVLVPVANLCVALREVLAGEVDLPMLGFAWLISAAAAAYLSHATLRVLASERLLVAAHLDRAAWRGGPELFPHRVMVWFVGLWALMFLALVNVPFLAALETQLLFNLVLIFLGGSLLMIRVYRLDPRRAMSLQPVNPSVWPGVLVGAPAFFFAAVALAKFSAALFPLPAEMLEQYSQLVDSSTRPLYELLLLVAVLPALCEEIAFRGLLLHGLRQRLKPVPLCLVVGVVFAVFHLDLVRLLPTAVLGALLAALTLRTGSIYPAMLWHALNNGTAIMLSHFEVSLDELSPFTHGAAIFLAGLALFWIWRVEKGPASS
jgi:sodium transport system permease protein